MQIGINSITETIDPYNNENNNIIEEETITL